MRWITDAGHGWLEVSTRELIKHNLVEKISDYSYVSWDCKKAYLEEDCDAGIYLHTVNPKGFIPTKIYDEEAPCRSLPSFKAFKDAYNTVLQRGRVI